ncbi:uncharacterized protein LOC113236324 isoform X2 [Hyposmocoma kahamanoa]|uniref:uncharacterized protein LOC113236324 isoform X2 n=1 Tax=Hyposmocoma kahamanoa TaxID=1477025 RepID=UPI000E6D9F80|nr:uncharacterized protein LOC113236324 isoform X2 [Hyposmocoma kahamanoa]
MLKTSYRIDGISTLWRMAVKGFANRRTEVDEEIEEPEAASPGCAEERRRRPDLLDERLGRQFAEFRRRRAPRDVIREPPEESAGCDSAPAPAPRPPGAVGGPK